MRTEGKRVIVTGASSGIGRALTLSLAGRGAVLTIAGRRGDKLEAVSREAVERFPDSPRPTAVPCDVSSYDDVVRLVGGTVERLGSVDVLINNAGISVFGEARLTSVDDFRDVMSVNFFGALHCALEVLPFMRRQDSGLIVNVATVAALHGVPYLAAYCASKSALVSFSQSLRAELAGSGVGVMIVYPGYTDTEIFASEKKVGGAVRPSGRYARAADVAETIARGMEAGGRDVILTAQGNALNVLRGLAPAVVKRVMGKMARRLSDEGGPSKGG